MIECVSYSVSTLYNFTNSYKWSNYFEYVILLIQDYILIATILFFRGEITRKCAYISLTYCVVLALFALGFMPKNILSFLIVSCSNFLKYVENIKVIFSLALFQCLLHRKYYNSSRSLEPKTQLPSALLLGSFLRLLIWVSPKIWISEHSKTI